MEALYMYLQLQYIILTKFILVIKTLIFNVN